MSGRNTDLDNYVSVPPRKSITKRVRCVFRQRGKPAPFQIGEPSADPADEDSKAGAIEVVPDRALEAFKAGGDYVSILREEHQRAKKEMAAAAMTRAAESTSKRR